MERKKMAHEYDILGTPSDRWKAEPTWWVRIYIGGNIDDIRRTCREHCHTYGLCVTVQECDFIYTGGSETGACIGLINYPRFPMEKEFITKRAKLLAEKLLDKACQHSVLVMTPETTEWFSRRRENEKVYK